MPRSLFSMIGKLIRLLAIFVLIAVLLLVAFIGYKGSQPMQIPGAGGMTYWQFMSDRAGTIRELPAKCQQRHIAAYLITVPFYPFLYTYAGIYPESYLAQHTQPHPAIPEGVELKDAPNTWWSLVERVTWDVWVDSPSLDLMPECKTNPPKNVENIDNWD